MSDTYDRMLANAPAALAQNDANVAGTVEEGSVERDPRVDPEPEDEIARPFANSAAGTVFRKVVRAHGGFVVFVRDNGYRRRPQTTSLFKWRRWASNAEVIHRAD